ncbi:MAG: precorrin-3B C(17)-methyltransferase [Dongiaceae bacterium]
MTGATTLAPAIVVLGQGSLPVAERLKVALPGSRIHGLRSRTGGADEPFDDFGEHLRSLYLGNVPLIVMCAAGIVIRTLAPWLSNKRAEPPVLAVAEDGSAVVPLLGGLSGVNALARQLGEVLGIAPAITTTGEIRFRTTLLHPPAGYTLQDPAAGKTFISDLLAGASLRIEGDAPWITETGLPVAADGALSVVVTERRVATAPDRLVYHPRAVAIGVVPGDHVGDLADYIRQCLEEADIAWDAVAGLFTAEAHIGAEAIHRAGQELGLPVRFLPMPDGANAAEIAQAASRTGQSRQIASTNVALAVAAQAIDAANIGRGRGRLAVIGLGPGGKDWLSPEAKAELERATDFIGYVPYLDMVGPLTADQRKHPSDNREEELRAKYAFELAAQGKSVAVISSGDPGIFAMATAILETLHHHGDASWHAVELCVMPGITAAQAAAARFGAPLGHDFCVLSLSDVLKPWQTIEERLAHAAQADLVIAIYNPISKFRPWQLERARDILLHYRKPETPVLLGKDVTRPAEHLRVSSLEDLTAEMVDSRTVVIVGSSKTQRFPKFGDGEWVYTPRRYEP